MNNNTLLDISHLLGYISTRIERAAPLRIRELFFTNPQLLSIGMDDLFGGLPAVSTSNAGENASAIASVADAVDRRPKPVLASATNDDEKKQVSTINDDDEKQPSYSGKQPPSKQTATYSSLVNSIGTAGTMMAFVPHAIRNKKRKTIGSGSHTRTMAKQDSAISQTSSSIIAQLVVDSNFNNNDVIRKSPSEIIVHMKSDNPSGGCAENGNIRDDYNNNDRTTISMMTTMTSRI